MTIKATKRIVHEMELPLEVTGISLLTVDEARNLPKCVPSTEISWWLLPDDRLAGGDRTVVPVMGNNGYISLAPMSDMGKGLRPVLDIWNLHMSLREGEEFLLAGHEWIVLSNNRAICKDIISANAYRKDTPVYKDETPYVHENNYSGSDIKRLLCTWAERNGLYDIIPGMGVTVNYDKLPSLIGFPDSGSVESNIDFMWNFSPDEEYSYMNLDEISRVFNIPASVLKKIGDPASLVFSVSSAYSSASGYYVELGIVSSNGNGSATIRLTPDDRLKEAMLNMSLNFMKEAGDERAESLARALLQTSGFPVDRGLTRDEVQELSNTACSSDEAFIAKLNSLVECKER